jgi:hypothetical protein
MRNKTYRRVRDSAREMGTTFAIRGITTPADPTQNVRTRKGDSSARKESAGKTPQGWRFTDDNGGDQRRSEEPGTMTVHKPAVSQTKGIARGPM